MAYARSCNKDASIHVPLPLQTLLLIISAIVVLGSSMLSVAAGVATVEPPPGGYRFGLTHGNFTNRSRRAAATSAELLGDDVEISVGASTSTPRKSMVHFRENEYLMDVEVVAGVEGQKRHEYKAIVDTGSSLIWIEPPPTSDNICWGNHRLRCDEDDGWCARASSPCKCERGQCDYVAKYGDKFQTLGLMCLETLRFRRLQPDNGNEYISVPNIAIGLSKEKKCTDGGNECDLKEYNGMVGLGRGKQSLVAQLKVHNFSYCLTTYDNTQLTSPLLLGSPDPLKESCKDPNNNHCEVQKTSLFRHPSWYYVHLEKIKIGDTVIDVPPKPKEEPNKPEEKGASEATKTPNMFIDSGTTYTFLEKTAYHKLLEYLNKHMKEVAKKEDKGCFCWTDTKEVPRLPDLELHFDGGAVMYLHKNKIMELDENRLCLTIKPVNTTDEAGPGASLLGNIQQQNIHMHFDVANNQLSFVQVDDCTKV